MVLANDRYAYRVIWSDEDEEYVGLCAEFPSLSWLAGTPEEALQGVRSVVAEVVSDMQANDEPVPKSLVNKVYKGNLSVRVPPEVHRKLVIQAAEEKVSLNRLVSAKLAANW